MRSKRARLLVSIGIGVAVLAATGAQAAVWVANAPTGTPPDPRMAQTTSAYDEANDRMIFFGGHNGTVWLSDTWVLENATGKSGDSAWTQLAPTGTPPSGRLNHSVVYAPSSNRLIVYGGCLGHCSPADSGTYILTNANGLGGTPGWSSLGAAGADGREAHAAVYDDVNNRMIIFGGQNAFNTYTSNPQVRVLTNADGTGGDTPTWTTLTPSGTPPSNRESSGVAYDAANNRMIVFGGATLACCAKVTHTYNDVWVLENANGLGGTPAWTQLAPTGTPPQTRFVHSAVYDSGTNALYVFGGTDIDTATQVHTDFFNDVWMLSNANGLGGSPEWTQLTPLDTPPSGRSGPVTAFNSTHNALVTAFGRNDIPSFTLFNDVWVLQLDSTAPNITVTTPSDGASYTLGSTVLADYACTDTGGSGLASCTGTVADGGAIDTATVGSKTFTVDATDNTGNASSLTHHYNVVYDFDGFFSPINNPPTFNAVKAGSAAPVKFSLDGDHGLDIFATGHPQSRAIACNTSAPIDGVEETVTAGSSSLSYDSSVDEYTYVWKTRKAWSGTCRQLEVGLKDGEVYTALFQFK
jgi:hypothetical protein